MLNTNNNPIQLPELKPSGRIREYKQYSDEIKARVLYEHLINGKEHRWLDIYVLGISSGRTNGRNSANILYYFGLKANYRGLFKDKTVAEVIKILTEHESSYLDVIRLLKLLDRDNLDSHLISDQLLTTVVDDIDSEQFEEGNVSYYYGKRYERIAKNRANAIRIHGLNCMGCGFNYAEVYGKRGKDFIEIHHINPLSQLEKSTIINVEKDLVPLCSNCHRMVHRKKDAVLSIEELKRTILGKFKFEKYND